MPADLRTVEPDVLVSVPTQVQAMQWTRPNRERVLQWLAEEGAQYVTAGSGSDADDMVLSVLTRTHHLDLAIATPQGMKPVLPGDWVVRGVLREWYPVADKVVRLRYRRRPPAIAGSELGQLEEAAAQIAADEADLVRLARTARAAGATDAQIADSARRSVPQVRALLAGS